MKEIPAARKKPAVSHGPTFVPCGRETHGGAQKPGQGTTCLRGFKFFWAMYQGQMERFAGECDCLKAWRRDKESMAS